MKYLILAALLGAGAAGAETQSVSAAAAPPPPATSNVTVIIETSEGTMTAELDAAKAPATVKNFVAYVNAKFYDGTVFHRVIQNFMIQGGGFTADMQQKRTNPPIVNEGGNGLKNDRGTLAMARLSDPNSATSQFFINHVDNANLNRPSRDGYGYAVFGKLTAGLDVLDKIAAVPTGVDPRTGMPDVPLKPVVIKSIRIK